MGGIITFFESKDWEKEEYLKRLGERLGDRFQTFQLEFVPYTLKANTASLHTKTQIAVVYLNSVVDEEVLNQMKALRLVITRTTGIEHIDFLACKRRGIEVVNAPVYASTTVPEHAIALMFALAKRLKTAIQKMQSLDFSREGLLGFDLYGKIAGVIGTGNIGSHICRILHGIGLKILGFDLNQNRKLEQDYGVKYVSLNELLQNSDVIFLAVPYTKETHHLINIQNIKLAKKNAMLINIARGPIVETEALIWALENGKLQGGVALDVFEGEKILTEATYLSETCPVEPLQKAMKTIYLYRFSNFILTPHVAYYTEEALERLMNAVIEEISYFLLYKLGTTTYGEYF